MILNQDLGINNRRIRDACFNWFLEWDWDLFLTIAYGYYKNIPNQTAVRATVKFLNWMRRSYKKARFAGIIQFVHIEATPHTHTLLVSDPRYPKTLGTYFNGYGELTNMAQKLRSPIALSGLRFPRNKGVTGKMTRGWGNETICGYVTSPRNMDLSNMNKSDIYAYRPNLLESLKRSEP